MCYLIEYCCCYLLDYSVNVVVNGMFYISNKHTFYIRFTSIMILMRKFLSTKMVNIVETKIPVDYF